MARSCCEETTSPFGNRHCVPVGLQADYSLVPAFTIHCLQHRETRPRIHIFKGNGKGDVSEGPTTTFKSWSTEATNYLRLEEPLVRSQNYKRYWTT
eukprot:1294079-Amphidinium_carterae.1